MDLHPTDWAGPQPPEFIHDLIARGFPPDAVRDDNTIDLDVAARYGWTTGPGYIAAPAQ